MRGNPHACQLPEVCQSCPLWERCPVDLSFGLMTVKIDPKEVHLVRRRQRQQTPEFQQACRKRGSLEATSSIVKRPTGMSRMGVRGKPSVFNAMLLKIAGFNILRNSKPNFPARIKTQARPAFGPHLRQPSRRGNTIGRKSCTESKLTRPQPRGSVPMGLIAHRSAT